MAVEPVNDMMTFKSKKGADMNNKVVVEETLPKEDAHKGDAAQKTHKSTGGSQAHAFVRHLIHKAEARYVRPPTWKIDLFATSSESLLKHRRTIARSSILGG
jgi:protein subunit release factor A